MAPVGRGRETLPLKTLAEVLAWTPDGEPQSFPMDLPRSGRVLPGAWSATDMSWATLLSTPLTKDSRERPRTLVCHDMQGGYLGDRWEDGCQEDAYYLSAWSTIDTFVYFSHHLLTIPPAGWVTAARRHGVQVLGTIITEWEPGRRLLEHLLEDVAATTTFVAKAVAIAAHHGFHGWLVNIENPVRPDLVPALVRLVARLSEGVREELGEQGAVIWYDSVTEQGELAWQDEVNPSNSTFLGAAHGIFLNYCWKTGGTDAKTGAALPDNLANTVANLPPGRLPAEVYVGVDVFGRGCLGGGGWNTAAAVAAARARGLSVAIFAPGWTWEAAEGGTFMEREERFWRLLQPHLWAQGPGLGGAGAGHSVFSSCFGLGRGPGNHPAPPWANMALMAPQPTLTSPLVRVVDSLVALEPDQVLALTSGGQDTLPVWLLRLPLAANQRLLVLLLVRKPAGAGGLRGVVGVRLGLEGGEEEVLEEVKDVEEEMRRRELEKDGELKEGWECLGFLTLAREGRVVEKLGVRVEEAMEVHLGKLTMCWGAT